MPPIHQASFAFPGGLIAKSPFAPLAGGPGFPERPCQGHVRHRAEAANDFKRLSGMSLEMAGIIDSLRELLHQLRNAMTRVHELEVPTGGRAA